jgi:hypothetical protein
MYGSVRSQLMQVSVQKSHEDDVAAQLGGAERGHVHMGEHGPPSWPSLNFLR